MVLSVLIFVLNSVPFFHFPFFTFRAYLREPRILLSTFRGCLPELCCSPPLNGEVGRGFSDEFEAHSFSKSAQSYNFFFIYASAHVLFI